MTSKLKRLKQVLLLIQEKKQTKNIKEMKKKWITVLDYETSRVYQYQVTINKHAEEYIAFKGHRLSNVEWMEHQFHSIITK